MHLDWEYVGNVSAGEKSTRVRVPRRRKKIEFFRNQPYL